MTPTTAQDWIAVANERAADAEALQKERPNSIGAVYMAGYAIECSLKALLQKRGIPFPTHGKEGHHLGNLWKASGLKFSDIKDAKGTKIFFLEKEKWNTDLRYERFLPNSLGLDIAELMEGAKQLNNWIQTQVNRSKPRKSK
ncbi:HEPN domain-containing protein [Limnofasciculus baicalensis]|uniref:HEPN domain-containing protein n=1 Tax=Limnofasciculus baicalensis BBK-W-15 TaxID=2699891 RepID=A0AAE3KTI0_9CYAN|nr:HEPN domain-containing protein [Limnofasciculus baicalensis]MCP2730547.1 HEPN domain-containing protein [Limnofasciculus baicalensis BBK-W-15]